MRRWLGFINSDLHKSFGLIFGKGAFTTDATCQEQIAAGGIAKAVQLFGIVDKQLVGKQWVTGTRSIVDPYLYTMIRWAHALKIDMSGLGNLEAFFDRMNGDAGVQAALNAQGLQ